MTVTTRKKKKKTTTARKKKGMRKPRRRIDHRKQLFNDGRVGPIEKIQVSTERIVKLRGILFDIDPPNYRCGPLLRKLPKGPRVFYKRYLREWLDRDPVLKKCEVRMTGRGLHAILWFADPVELNTDADRERWAAKVQVIQAALPIDPDQPGITATTRALGSTNSKNKQEVFRLRKRNPVSLEEVDDLYERMRSSPFKTVLKVLSGTEAPEPCPICGKEDTRLASLDFVGKCYGSCGKVKLDRLYDVVLAPRPKKQ